MIWRSYTDSELIISVGCTHCGYICDCWQGRHHIDMCVLVVGFDEDLCWRITPHITSYTRSGSLPFGDSTHQTHHEGIANFQRVIWCILSRVIFSKPSCFTEICAHWIPVISSNDFIMSLVDYSTYATNPESNCRSFPPPLVLLLPVSNRLLVTGFSLESDSLTILWFIVFCTSRRVYGSRLWKTVGL